MAAKLSSPVHSRPSSIDMSIWSEKDSRSSEDLKSDTYPPSLRTSSESDVLLRDSDVEAQTLKETSTSSSPEEYTVATSTKLIYLALYFSLNLGLTLSNKVLLDSASFPWLLTVSHTTTTFLGCSIMLAAGQLQLTKLSIKDNMILVAFSTLFTLNIAMSNVSLSLVSVPFHQITRSTCPVVTILIYRVFYGRSYSNATYLSMIPLIAGVALATFGSYYFTTVGFVLTLLGVLLASTKTIATNRLMTGSLRLSAMEALFRMTPLAAAQCLVYAYFSGELSRLQTIIPEQSNILAFVAGVLANAAIAFALNIVSFQTNKVAGALTMTVCGNVKQAVTILIGIVLFQVRIHWINGLGTAIALVGAAYYSKVELDRKRNAAT